MEDYRPNSHRSKEESNNLPVEKKKVQPVVKGKVVKKTNNVRKLTDIFVSEDAKNIKSYVLMDVLVPAVKKAISDIVTNGIDMILYGESGRSKKRSTGDYVSYNRYSSSDSRDRDRDYSGSSRYSYDDIVFENRRDAEEVLDELYKILNKYHIVSVADLYDLVDMSGNYTDYNYGWNNLNGADVIHTRDGYILKLPRIVSIK